MYRFPENGASYPVRVFLMKDIVTVGIDATGISLHKRGYREVSGKAPITETLAAALIIPLLEMDQMIYSSLSRISSGNLDHRRIHIVSLNVHFYIITDHIISLIDHIIPVLFSNQIIPFFRQK